MNRMNRMNRREAMGAVAAGAAASTLGGCAAMGGKSTAYGKHDNGHFYSADGGLDEVAAKDAYYEMMEYFGYPIPERLRGEDFWTLDFALGNFTEVGMAGILWVNNQEHDYMGHEIYLLPHQMIPEHWHLATEKGRAKVEAWHLRHGSVTLYSEGEPTPGGEGRIPPLHRDIAVARTELLLAPGEHGQLANPGEKHWMLAGPEGAIVSEYASFHDMDGLRFTHPGISL
jgi:D-lyxose ketol-isomerase